MEVLGEPQSYFKYGEQENLCPCEESNPHSPELQPVGLVTTQTELSQLLRDDNLVANSNWIRNVLFASYDSQGYGGGIRPRLHTGYSLTCSGLVWSLILYSRTN
jgi:hypothetical protein